MSEESDRDALLRAILPAVPFDGWTRRAMRAAARRAGLGEGAEAELFPRGPRDLVAWFSRWADRETLAALARRNGKAARTPERVAEAALARLALLLPHREAVRRSLALMSLPQNVALGARLLYRTVDTIWFAAGDRSTDFNFYTKRGLLAGIYAATTLYWLDDRSEGMEATRAFLNRRLADIGILPRLRRRIAQMAAPLEGLRSLRARFSGAG